MSDNKDEPMLPEDPVQEDGPVEDEYIRVLAELRAEAEMHKDRALRALAEVENVRKRLERERDEAKIYSVTRFARDLLAIADNLSRALTALPGETRSRVDDTLKAVIDGVEATERELKATLARHGVKAIEAGGVRFDPHLHQAIAEVPGMGAAPGTVVNVVQSGYMIGDRLLRPAMVTVAKAETGMGANGTGGGIDTKV